MSMSATRYLFRHSSIHPIISEWCCCSNFKAAWPVRLCTDFIHKSFKEALPLENRKARARECRSSTLSWSSHRTPQDSPLWGKLVMLGAVPSAARQKTDALTRCQRASVSGSSGRAAQPSCTRPCG